MQFAGYKNQVIRCTGCGNIVWQPKGGKGDFFSGGGGGGGGRTNPKSGPDIIDVDFEEKWSDLPIHFALLNAIFFLSFFLSCHFSLQFYFVFTYQVSSHLCTCKFFSLHVMSTRNGIPNKKNKIDIYACSEWVQTSWGTIPSCYLCRKQHWLGKLGRIIFSSNSLD